MRNCVCSGVYRGVATRPDQGLKTEESKAQSSSQGLIVSIMAERPCGKVEKANEIIFKVV